MADGVMVTNTTDHTTGAHDEGASTCPLTGANRSAMDEEIRRNLPLQPQPTLQHSNLPFSQFPQTL